jgi:hypothetical protein
MQPGSFFDMLHKQSSELKQARTQQVFAELNPDAQKLMTIPPSYWAQKSMVDKQSTNLYGLGSKKDARDLYYDKNMHNGLNNTNPYKP